MQKDDSQERQGAALSYLEAVLGRKPSERARERLKGVGPEGAPPVYEPYELQLASLRRVMQFLTSHGVAHYCKCFRTCHLCEEFMNFLTIPL